MNRSSRLFLILQLLIPGHGASFGIIKAAQSDADYGGLARRGRRASRIHLTGEVTRGLAKLGDIIKRALS